MKQFRVAPFDGAAGVLARRFCVGLGAVMVSGNAAAFDIPVDPDWSVRLDNTLTYNLGIRAQDVDPKIGNNPNFDESDYQFKDAGDIVDSSISLRSEFSAVFQNNYGLRVTGSAWKNFAYDGKVASNPGEIVPGLPYADTISYSSGRYSSYTKRFYEQGGQLLDAFVFGNFNVGGHRTSVKFGRQNENWGNAVFFGSQGISYSQSYLDLQKAFANPGTQIKDLFLPRAQISIKTALTPTLTLGGQYFLEFKGDRLPEGGTFLGFVDPLFSGPDRIFVGVDDSGGSPQPVYIERGKSIRPDDVSDNFGVKLSWSPEWLRGSLGGYYRHFDETQPWTIQIGADPVSGATNYHKSYPTGVDLVGLSLDKQIGSFSTGFELSYRHNTGLLTSGQAPTANDMAGREGARGDTLNAIANVLALLTSTPLYDTGTAIAEVSYTRRLKVTENEDFFQGLGYGGCPTNHKWDNCATRNYVAVAFQFDPQWLQVFPGIDIDMPISETFGVWGNGAGLNQGFQGQHIYSAGVRALYRQNYNVKLAYNGFFWHHQGLTSQYEGGPEYYAGGNGYYWYNDRSYLSLTFQASF